MLFLTTPQTSTTPGDFTMKKLMTLMLGLTLALGSVAVTFAQDTTAPTTTKKKASKKKPAKKKKADTTKTGR
jgi:hypothetical protein